MRYVQLRAFHHVAIHGGFSKAARALGLTQPALSDQVARLEAEHDVLLFDRSHKQVCLTPFGQKLLAHTRRLFEAEEQTREFLAESRALRAGKLRIIADSPFHVLDVLSTFRTRFPGIFVSLRAGNSDDVRDALINYRAEIGVLGEVPATARFQCLPLSSTPVIAFAAASLCADRKFGLEKGQVLTADDLQKLPLVMREKGSRTRQIMERYAKRNGIALTPAIEAEGREAVREIVAAGAGIGFVSRAEFGHDGRLVPLDIAGLSEPMQEALICLTERGESRLIRTFMDVAREAVSAMTKTG